MVRLSDTKTAQYGVYCWQKGGVRNLIEKVDLVWDLRYWEEKGHSTEHLMGRFKRADMV